MLVVAARAHLANHDEARVDADANREPDRLVSLEGRVQGAHGVQHPERRADGPPGIILVGVRPAEIDEQRVAEKLSDVTVEPLDDLGARPLV